MLREEVIALARKAGFAFPDDYDTEECTRRLVRFANLVSAVEREACLDLCKNVAAIEEADPKKSPRHTAWARVCAVAIAGRKED